MPAETQGGEEFGVVGVVGPVCRRIYQLMGVELVLNRGLLHPRIQRHDLVGAAVIQTAAADIGNKALDYAACVPGGNLVVVDLQ